MAQIEFGLAAPIKHRIVVQIVIDRGQLYGLLTLPDSRYGNDLNIRAGSVSRTKTVCDIPAIGNDFYYTLMDMASVEIPEEKVCEGKSLVPLLEGKKIKDRALYWHFPHYSNHGMQSPGGAGRYGDYKLLEYFENGTVQSSTSKTTSANSTTSRRRSLNG